ncbi:MAG: sulfur carrier protein ThiS [Chloroflexota bacterium]
MILVNGRSFEWREGLTIQQIMEEKRYTSPRIVVKVNDVLVKQVDWVSCTVDDGDDVRIIHLIAGG